MSTFYMEKNQITLVFSIRIYGKHSVLDLALLPCFSIINIVLILDLFIYSIL